MKLNPLNLLHPGLAHDDRSNHVLTGPVVRTARMCVLPPTLPLHHACNVASNEAEAPGFGYEQVRDSGFGYEQVGDFPTPIKMGGMDSEYLPLHAPTGPHPLRAFSPQVLTFMTRHGPFDHLFCCQVCVRI